MITYTDKVKKKKQNLKRKYSKENEKKTLQVN
jgi:hypothetical protein